MGTSAIVEAGHVVETVKHDLCFYVASVHIVHQQDLRLYFI